jgi:HSP20 family molecular chaperone IbpA
MGRVPDGGTSYPPPSQGDQIQTPRVPYGGSYPPPSLSDQIKTPWVGGGNIWESVNIPIFETSDVVGYPKANGYVLPNGDTIIEIAITGFDKEELKINREDQVLVVKAHKENKIDAENDGRKYLYHQIAERNFDYKVSCSNKQDLDKIEATVNNGKLIIKIPLKEYTYPTKKEIQIL